IIRDDPDGARFPRFRPAARLAVARRIALAGEGQRAGALARPRRLLFDCDHAVAADLHRRSGARRLRSAKDLPMSEAGHMSDTTPLLAVKDLSVAFRQGEKQMLAVDRISFDIRKGETVAIVGESGSGKSVTALSVMKLLPYPAASHPSGSVRFKGKELLQLSERDIRSVRGDDITIIFQEPMTSLNP